MLKGLRNVDKNHKKSRQQPNVITAIYNMLLSSFRGKVDYNEGVVKMKKCTLEHVETKGFVLLDEENLIIDKVNAGDNEEDINWILVEQQANELGYTLY